MARKGKHRAGPDNKRLRQELQIRDADITWYRGRLLDISRRNRALRAQVEIAEGRLLASEQLTVRQAAELEAKNERIAELERLLKTSGEDTTEMPVPAELTAA